jgi:hypothetical protein
LVVLGHNGRAGNRQVLLYRAYQVREGLLEVGEMLAVDQEHAGGVRLDSLPFVYFGKCLFGLFDQLDHRQRLLHVHTAVAVCLLRLTVLGFLLLR